MTGVGTGIVVETERGMTTVKETETESGGTENEMRRTARRTTAVGSAQKTLPKGFPTVSVGRQRKEMECRSTHPFGARMATKSGTEKGATDDGTTGTDALALPVIMMTGIAVGTVTETLTVARHLRDIGMSVLRLVDGLR